MNSSFSTRSRGPFRIKMISERVFQVHSASGQAFEGPKMAIADKAVQLGVLRHEVDLALRELTKMGHDIAEFGVLGSFLFTRLSNTKKVA